MSDYYTAPTEQLVQALVRIKELETKRDAALRESMGEVTFWLKVMAVEIAILGAMLAGVIYE